MAIDVLLKIHQFEPAVLVRGDGDGATNAKAATKRPAAEAFASEKCAAQRRPPAPPTRASARQRPEESDPALAKQPQDAAGPEKVLQTTASATADGTQETCETKRVDRERDNNAKLAKIDWVQCEGEGCGKWRMLPPHVEANELPDRFVCSMAHWLPRPSCVVPGDDEDNWADMEDSDNSATEDSVDSDDSDWESQKYTAAAASRAADVGTQRVPKETEQSVQEVDGNGCAGDERPTKRRRGSLRQQPLTRALGDCKLAPEQRRAKLVGVQWNKVARAWRASISQSLEGSLEEKVYLGTFATAKAAAQAYDLAARRMRGPNAHGGGRYAKYSKFIIQGHYIAVSTETEDTVCTGLNYPTRSEQAAFKQLEKQRSQDKRHRTSRYVGVTWRPAGAIQLGYWEASLGKANYISNSDGTHKFYSEKEAAVAYDAAARKLRGDKAHGGRGQNRHIWREWYIYRLALS